MRALPWRKLLILYVLTVPLFGAGTANELSEYLESYREGANAGNPKDQYNLGASYRWGVNVPRDPALAITWIKKSAEQDYSLAERALGEMLERGEGVAPNGTQALLWYKRAARHGDQLAADSAARLEAKRK